MNKDNELCNECLVSKSIIYTQIVILHKHFIFIINHNILFFQTKPFL